MQLIFESLLIAVIGAIAIIIVLILIGVSIGYKEEIERKNIGLYARAIIIPIFLVATVFLYIQGQLGSDILFLSIVWLLPVIFCTDWKKLGRTRKSDDEQ
ncbi:MAG: hypothetical protein ACFFE6_14000 [Candidatus Thorarchaeota archaeon]